MKKLGVLLLLGLAVVMLGGNALAQNVGDKSVFFVTYYSNANTTDAQNVLLRLINDGGASTSEVEGQANGTLWASIYVFDDSQELQECCSCYVSADGLLSEWVDFAEAGPYQGYLTSNSLTGKLNHVGVIKIISSSSPDPTNNVPKAGLHGTMVHQQLFAGDTYLATETPLADANLVSAEQSALQSSCSFAITLGSGAGTCSCTEEDHDF